MNFELLNHAGLNMQAVFNIADLPNELQETLGELVVKYSQLILIGHGGKLMWETLQASAFADTANPIDSFSIDTAERWFVKHFPDNKCEIIYPMSQRIVPLQQLGTLAGWHNNSPFRIGINTQWGSWFAYRTVMLADTCLKPTVKMNTPSPCDSCIEKPCITVCPVDALSGNSASLKSCISYRMESDSTCRDRCFSRIACPVATKHRYTMAQFNYHYTRSMQTIEIYYK